MKYKIYEAIEIGTLHKNFCEDYLLINENKNYILAAVFDGCSSGNESYFASALLGKITTKAFDLLDDNKDFKKDFKNLIKNTVTQFFNIAKNLKLDQDELLSTAIISLIDKEQNKIEVIAIGDGAIFADKNQYIIDQNNTPNYLAYYINKLDISNNFDNWLKHSTISYSFENSKNFVISTDGILSFRNPEYYYPRDKIREEIYEELILSEQLMESQSKLKRTLRILNKTNNWEHYDDLAIIRIKIS